LRSLSRDLDARVRARLDARLDAGACTPLAVALSGGGDSLALTLMAADWAQARGRRLLVLNVDHGLNPDSGGWARMCGEAARRAGASFQALAWTGPHPARGLPAAARRARHGLLANAARAAGARVLLMGHTADDLAEAAAMRAEGSTTPSPREWSPSPAWPEGRDVFLLRPLLGERRETLRTWLAARGETWIEDPANADPRFARSRARMALAGSARIPAPDGDDGPEAAAELSGHVRATAFGLVLDREALRRAAPSAARRLVAAACLAAGGGSRPPRGEALDRLAARLTGEVEVRATLAGALVLADGAQVAWGRTAGEMGREGAGDLALEPGVAAVFDRRLEVRTESPVRVFPLAGRLSRPAPSHRASLRGVPPPFRGGLPAVERADGVHLAGSPASGVEVRLLARDRFLAACGAVPDEASAAALSAGLAR
jgi:tRNA(Ile)-lysidine synthase